jgi:hypothetical protein
MMTRYFDQPVPVRYRTDTTWRRVYALGVRRFADSYMVLVAMGPPELEQLTAWVPRARIGAGDPMDRSA